MEDEETISLRDILTEVRSQRDEIVNVVDTKLAALKGEIQGTSHIVATEFKRLKSDKGFAWKKEGTKIQFNFNEKIEDDIKQALWGMEHDRAPYASEVLNEALEKIKQRNKLIKLADSSENGWETARQYEVNPIASDSEDEKKIYRAEARAAKKRKAKRSVNVSRGKYARGGGSSQFNNNASQFPHVFGGIASSSSTGQAGGSTRQLFRANRGACFGCGDFSHYRRDCPFTRARPPPAKSGE